MLAQPGKKLIVLLTAGLLLAVLLMVISRFGILIFLLFAALLVFFAYFFRDPERKTGKQIVSPADGIVADIDEKRNFIAIFMNVHDVHVNRAPEAGKILRVEHHDGKHYSAFGTRVCENEHTLIELESNSGKFKIVQIAGVFARRIVTYVKPGDIVEKGQRIGIIFFGSRVELHMPQNAKFVVKRGEKVKAGETTIGVWLNAVD
jgi:phosphatidylserine decarboxylase